MSRDEMRTADVAAMGQALGEVYAELWQEVARLFSKWEEYVELFGTKESRIALMNEAASDFFGKLQQSQFERVLLDIACVTDSPKMGTQDNLSVRALPVLIQDDALKQRVSDLVTNALNKCQFARDWRHRYLAHRDLALALGKAKPLQPASRQKVWDALDALTAVLNELSQHYRRSTTMFRGVVGPLRGAVALLYMIDDGVRVEQERRERSQRGDFRESDYKRDV